MDWMFERELRELGLMPRRVDGNKPADPAINQQSRDVSWYHRGEECPH